MQNAHPIGLHRDPCSCGLPCGTALDEFWPETLLVQGRRQGQPSDPSAHDQDPFHVNHLFPLSLSQASCAWSTTRQRLSFRAKTATLAGQFSCLECTWSV